MKKSIIVGAVYGIGLGMLAFAAAGYGHGTYVVMGIVSAPLGLFGIAIALIGLPFLWAGIFAISHNVKLGAVAMVIHYLSAVIMVSNGRFAQRLGQLH